MMIQVQYQIEKAQVQVRALIRERVEWYIRNQTTPPGMTAGVWSHIHNQAHSQLRGR